jgi:zinc protease
MSRKFFPNHPYGRPSGGTPETIKTIGRDDMLGFVKTRLAKGNLYLGVVGDITPAALGQLLDKAFGHLPAKSVAVTVADVSPITSGETIVVRKPVSQSAILFGHEGILRHDPDFYSAFVINYVLGGGAFNSRLWIEVREKRGLAYSVGTSLQALDHGSLLMGSAGTDNARVAETLKLVRAEWQQVARDGISAKELDDAKRYLTGSYALRFTSSGRIARMLVGLQLQRFGPDYIDKRNGYINAVTLADAKRVAARLLQPSKLTFVVVGQPEGVTELEAPVPR